MAREYQNKERERRSQAQEIGSSAPSCGSSVSDRRASARVQTRGSQRSQRSQSNEDADWVFDCRCGIHGKFSYLPFRPAGKQANLTSLLGIQYVNLLHGDYLTR